MAESKLVGSDDRASARVLETRRDERIIGLSVIKADFDLT